MNRLTLYLLAAFAKRSLQILLLLLVLIWLAQMLRLFDLVAAKGQDVFTLGAQALLSLPPIARFMLPVCMGLGLVRGLKALNATRELHAIHASGRLGGLFRAVVLFAGGGAVVTLLLANIVEPAANRSLNDWSVDIAADLVGRAIAPNRFTEVVPGVIVAISGRAADGRMTDFFADDRRDAAARQTYIAQSATLAGDDAGYVLRLENGRLQYLGTDGRMSEVAFVRYEMPLDTLTERAPSEGGTTERSTIELLAEAMTTGVWPQALLTTLGERAGDAARLVGLSLLIATLAGYPSGSRTGFRVPLEFGVVGLALLERSYGLSGAGDPLVLNFGGAALMILAAVAIYAARSRALSARQAIAGAT